MINLHSFTIYIFQSYVFEISLKNIKYKIHIDHKGTENNFMDDDESYNSNDISKMNSSSGIFHFHLNVLNFSDLSLNNEINCVENYNKKLSSKTFCNICPPQIWLQ